MSEKMTTISLPCPVPEFVDRGYMSRTEMIAIYREIAQQWKDNAEKILSAKDEDFIVEQHTGMYVRRNVVRI